MEKQEMQFAVKTDKDRDVQSIGKVSLHSRRSVLMNPKVTQNGLMIQNC